VTPGLAARATSAVVERAATYDDRWSDHAPVTVTFSA
jgi:exodeoxyribonuclease III